MIDRWREIDNVELSGRRRNAESSDGSRKKKIYTGNWKKEDGEC